MKSLICLAFAVFFSLSSYGQVLASQQIVIAGTGDSQNIMRVLAKHFEKLHPGVSVLVPDSVGSGGGVKALNKGEADLARTARPLKEKERPGLTEILFAKSPVVFATHPSVLTVENITTKQILEVYGGTLRNWKALGGADKKIYPVGREVGDSSRKVLNTTIDGFKDLKMVAKQFYTTQEAAAAIKDHQFTIGYLPLATAKSHHLKILTINGVRPEVSSIRKGSYPHITPLYLVRPAKVNQLAADFITFATSAEAGALLLEAGLVQAGR